MLFIEIVIAIYLIGSFIHFQVNKKRTLFKMSLLKDHISTSEELKKTVAMGLYLRFRDEKKDYNPTIKENSIFIKQDPYAFERFVAEIIKAVRGGTVWITPSVGDHGVDFEHDTEDGKCLGQVKCYKSHVEYEPTAILHSNMVKEEARAGYVVTTSAFT